MTEGDPNVNDPRLAQASVWFGELQTRIVAAMEALEVEFAGCDAAREPGRFVLEPWSRTDPSGVPGGGGRMAMLRGRLFEKMGVHSSIVHGSFPAEFAAQIPGAASDPRFWAAKMGVHSSIVHGSFPAEFAAQIPGAASDPRFWAAGLSLIAHPWSPHVRPFT